MARSSRRRSYAETVEGRRKVAKAFGIVILVLVCYEILSTMFVASFSIGSSSMEPTLAPGDLILASPLPLGPVTFFGKMPPFDEPKRGDLVVADLPYVETPGFWSSILDSLTRFFTFQRVSTLRRGTEALLSGPVLLRVMGIPGDTLLMEDFVFRIKASGSPHFLTEFELSPKPYDISRKPLPEGWTDDSPASGHMESVVLGEDQYFLAGDARSSSADSRYWGPVRPDRLRARVLLRYWPIARFGVP
jgi:signal peptidase I